MKRLTILCTTVGSLLTACGGSGGAPATPGVASTAMPAAAPTAVVTTQQAGGTLTIGDPGSAAASGGTLPFLVSPATRHAALFIDGVATAAGSTTTCTATTGTGSSCTITWTAQLAVPAAHTFAVEADSGPTGAPANTVLSEGAGSYPIVAGAANVLAALSLNGVVARASFTVGACSGVAPASLCDGTITLAAAGGNAIAYTGTTAVPTAGNLPSSGNVFDNGSASFVSSAPANGTITGTAQVPFSTLTAGLLSVSGVDTSGVYAYQVTCAAGASGTFGVTIGGGLTPSLAVTAAELAGLSLTYPAAIAVSGTAPSFSCSNGTIASATGTLKVY